MLFFWMIIIILALIAYVACLWYTGGVDKRQIELLYSRVRSKRAAPGTSF